MILCTLRRCIFGTTISPPSNNPSSFLSDKEGQEVIEGVDFMIECDGLKSNPFYFAVPIEQKQTEPSDDLFLRKTLRNLDSGMVSVWDTHLIIEQNYKLIKK